MLNVRDIILKRMKQLHIPSGYALAKRINHNISLAAINNYLSGRTEMTTGNLEIILQDLGCEGLMFKKTK